MKRQFSNIIPFIIGAIAGYFLRPIVEGNVVEFSDKMDFVESHDFKPGYKI
jgi:hypothetical protein